MGTCCGTATHDASPKASHSRNRSTVQNEFNNVPANALRMKPMAFDVIVPDTPVTSPALGGRSGDRDGMNMSCTLFNGSMHTVRDMSFNADRGGNNDPLVATMNNMSFTNSFKAVDKAAVLEFMKNVSRLAENATGKSSLLEESILGHSMAMDKSAMLGGGTATTEMTPEDTAYIMAGATLQDRVARLQEVETVLRQTIEGTWRVDNTLLQLACCQVVPTLRQRRRPWATAVNANNNASQGTGNRSKAGQRSQSVQSVREPARQPVLVIHAQGLQVDPSLSIAAAPATMSPTRGTTANVNDNTAARAAEPGEFSLPSNNGALADASLELSGTRSRLEPPQGAKLEQYELLALTCRDINATKCPGADVVDHTWDFLAGDKGSATLNEGKCLFRFMCQPLNEVDEETRTTIDAIINLSAFKDEVAENNTPKVDVNDPEDAKKYVAIIVKTMYMLPGVRVADVTKNMLVSTEYQKSCQPSANKVQDCDQADTFRLTMTIVRFIFSLTIQFRVSEITDPNVLQSLAVCDGMVPAKVMMLERTKRNSAKTDATAKVRSLLVYYPVNDGVLVDNFTIVLNTSLPKVVSKIMNTFGAQGAAQSVETTKMTRAYMVNRFGDTRQK